MAFSNDAISIVTYGYRRDSGDFEDRVITRGYFGNILGTASAAKIYNWLKKKLMR